MELLVYPKTEYALDASLETLHAESQSWLNDLEFWGDEMSFFYKLLHRREAKGIFPSNELADVEKELVKLNGERLTKTKSSVLSHERLLSSSLQSQSLAEEEVYREAHRTLLIEIYELQVAMRSFKKNVFTYYAQYE